MPNENLKLRTGSTSGNEQDVEPGKRITIRPYKVEDREVALDMCVKGVFENVDRVEKPVHWEDLHTFVEYVTPRFDDVPTMVKAKNSTAVDGNSAIVGTIGLKFSDDDKANRRAELVRMTVAPERRGEGIGKLMLEHLIEYARARLQCKEIHLTSVRNLSAAYQLYLKYGFVETRVLKTGNAQLDAMDMGWLFEMVKPLN